MPGTTPRSCLNCDATLGGEFCARCGQRDIEPRITLTEFAHEFAADHFGLDTRVGRTLVTLVRHPGRLTTEFFAGRRIRYVPPLRLYVSLSVLFFLCSAWTSHDTLITSHKGSGSATLHIDTGAGDTVTIERPGSVAQGAQGATTTRPGARPAASSDGGAVLVRDTLHDNAFVRFIKRRAHERLVDLKAGKPEAKQRIVEAFRHDLPDALFVLVPVFAAMLALLYRGQHRSYAEHLVFALHFQAFVFAVFLLTLIPFDLTAAIVMVALPVYMFVALRTVYAESARRTMGKLMVLGLGYIVANTAIMAVLGMTVFLFG